MYANRHVINHANTGDIGMSLTSLDLMGCVSGTADKLQNVYWKRVVELNAIGERGGSLAEIKAAEHAKRAAFEAWSAFVVGSGWEKR